MALLYAMLILISCRHDDEKFRRSEIIPEQDIVPILTDLYITDGLLTIPDVRWVFSGKDSTTNYMDVLQQHGYTKEKMDRTIHYYLVNNPKKLEKMYDQVIARLSEMESRFKTETVTPSIEIVNLWPRETSISIPEAGLYNMIDFDIQTRDTGMYDLHFDAIVYKDDQSLNLRSTVYFWKADTSETGIRDNWNSIELIHDGIMHSYTISKSLKDNSFTRIKGFLAEHDPQPGRWQKHVRITNIFLSKGGTK